MYAVTGGRMENNMKKISLFISVILMIQTLSASVFAQTPDEIGINNAAYDSKIEVLTRLGIYDAGTDAAASVTRAQMAKYLMTLYGINREEYVGVSSFPDVYSENPYAPYIAAGKAIGILNGDGQFYYPNYTLGPNEAVKLMVELLGYGLNANKSGGYPLGYVLEAARLDISENVDLSKTAITQGELADMIVRSFDVDVVMSNFDNVNGIYSEREGVSLLNAYMNMYKVKGIVQAVGESSFSTVSSLKDHVVINNVRYFDKLGLSTEYLGCPVEAYIKYDDGGDDLIAVEIIERKYNSLTIEFDELERNSNQFTNTQIVYIKGNKLETEALSPTVEVMYNGFSLGGEYSKQDLMPEYGYIQLIDNNDDKLFDVVKVWDYEAKPIKKIFESERQIVFTDTTNFDSASYEGNLIVLINSKPDDIRNMQAGMTLLMAYSKDGQNLVINAVKNNVTGIVSAVNYSYVVIDGKEYKAVPDDINAGSQGIFYMDERDRIVVWERADKTSEKYGYIVKLYYDSDEDVSRIRLLTEDGKIISYALRRKVNYNGRTYSSEDIIRLFKDQRTLILYQADANGTIFSFKTAFDNTSSKAGFDEDRFSLDYKNRLEYNLASGGLNQFTFSKYYVGGANTIIMRVPDYANPDEDEYRIVNKNHFSGLSTKYNIEIYDSNEGFAPRVVVVLSNSPYFNREISDIKTERTKYNAQSAIVSNQRGQTIINDEVVDIYEVYSNATMAQLKVALGTSFVWDNVMDTYIKDEVQTYPCPHADGYFIPSRDLKPGDIIQYETNANGLLQTLRIMYKSDSTNPLDQLYSQKYMGYTESGEPGKMTFEEVDYWFRGSYMFIGKVVTTERERVVFKISNNSYRSYNMTLSSTNTPNCYKYETSTGKVTLFSPLEIRAGDTVVLHVVTNTLGSALVIR